MSKSPIFSPFSSENIDILPIFSLHIRTPLSRDSGVENAIVGAVWLPKKSEKIVK
jgi:hypothetical protein